MEPGCCLVACWLMNRTVCFDFGRCAWPRVLTATEKAEKRKEEEIQVEPIKIKNNGFVLIFKQPTEYFDMGIFLAFFVVVSLVCLILLVKIKLKQRRSQVRELMGYSLNDGSEGFLLCPRTCFLLMEMPGTGLE